MFGWVDYTSASKIRRQKKMRRPYVHFRSKMFSLFAYKLFSCFITSSFHDSTSQCNQPDLNLGCCKPNISMLYYSHSQVDVLNFCCHLYIECLGLFSSARRCDVYLSNYLNNVNKLTLAWFLTINFQFLSKHES